MNIHIHSQDLFASLMGATLVEIEVGSSSYGLKDAQSDTDILCVYVPSLNKVNSFLNLHHVLQYKDEQNRIDYIFEDVFSFVRNCLSGDSTLNFEALHTETIKDSPLSFLYDQRFAFYNYNIVKAYLGFGKRDRKFLNASLTSREQVKKLTHIGRTYLFGQRVLERRLVLNDPLLKSRNETYTQMDFFEKSKEADRLCLEIEDLRKNVLNKRLELGQIHRCMKVSDQLVLDQSLDALVRTDVYLQKQVAYMDLSMFYEVNENGVNY
jgi:hypothetical protein